LQVSIDSNLCRGCRICELICSFHHARVFSPELSSIKISRNNITARIACSIEPTCDSCEGEVQLLCVKYCPYGSLKEAS